MRQNPIPSHPDGSIWVRSFPVRFTDGFSAAAHDHDWHQFSYVSEGAIRVTTGSRAFIASPNRAIWIPAGAVHREEIKSCATMRSLYFASGACRGPAADCAVFEVSPLLRELTIEASVSGALDARYPAQKRLAQMIADRIVDLAPAQNQELPMPRDPRLLALAKLLFSDPGNDEELAAHSRRIGVSARTAQRLFAKETGLSFSRWRQRLRLLAATERLANGSSVTDAAFDVGYASVSAFVFAFQREFGVTPGRFSRK